MLRMQILFLVVLIIHIIYTFHYSLISNYNKVACVVTILQCFNK